MGDPQAAGLTVTTLQGLRFPAPKAFLGKEEEWDTFQYKFRAYLTLADVRYKALLVTAEAADSEIDIDLEEQHVIELAAQLQNALIALTEGPAAKIVQRQERTENGLESWRLLHQRYAPSKRSKTTGQLMKILTWKFDMEQFENSFNDWESDILKFDSVSSTPFSDEVKICILYLATSGQLHNYLLMHTDLSTRYREVRTMVVNYMSTGRLMRDLKQHKAKQDQNLGYTPMEVDAIWRQIKSKGKGVGKGRGKGKGKKGKGKGKSKDKGKSKGKGKDHKGKGKSKPSYGSSAYSYK